MNKIVKTIVGIILVSSLTLTGCKQETKVVEEIKNVKVVDAVNSTIITEIEYASKLKANNEISISSKSPGKVAVVNFDVGQQVKKGDVLFALEAKDIQAQVQQQKAGVKLSKINLEKAKDSALMQQIITSEQNLKRAQLSFDTAKDNYEKVQQAYEDLKISQKELTEAENKYNNALLDLNAAKDNLNLLKQKSGPQNIQAAGAQVEQSEAGLSSAMAALDNTIIKSPISGVVAVRNVDVGETTPTGTPAYTIINTEEMISEINVSDKMVGKIKKGQILKVIITSLNNKLVEGTVITISPAADEKTQNFIIKVAIKNVDNSLRQGMFAKVMLPDDIKENILTVPKTAIKIENGINYIYIVEKGQVKKVAVSTGIFNDKVTEIISGIKSGDLVITEGQIFLNEGQKVKTIK